MLAYSPMSTCQSRFGFDCSPRRSRSQYNPDPFNFGLGLGDIDTSADDADAAVEQAAYQLAIAQARVEEIRRKRTQEAQLAQAACIHRRAQVENFRRRAQEEAARRLAQEEVIRRRAQEAALRRHAHEEALRRLAQDEAARRVQEQQQRQRAAHLRRVRSENLSFGGLDFGCGAGFVDGCRAPISAPVDVDVEVEVDFVRATRLERERLQQEQSHESARRLFESMIGYYPSATSEPQAQDHTQTHPVRSSADMPFLSWWDWADGARNLQGAPIRFPFTTNASAAPQEPKKDHKGKARETPAIPLPRSVPTPTVQQQKPTSASAQAVQKPQEPASVERELHTLLHQRLRTDTDPAVRAAAAQLLGDLFGASDANHTTTNNTNTSTKNANNSEGVTDQVGAHLHRTPALAPADAQRLLQALRRRRDSQGSEVSITSTSTEGTPMTEAERRVALSTVQRVEDSLRDLRATFVFPSALDFTPSSSSSSASSPAPVNNILPTTANTTESVSTTTTTDDSATATSTDPELAFTPRNAPLRAYEHALNGLLAQLDGVVSGGDARVRARRRAVVEAVEGALKEIERHVREASRGRGAESASQAAEPSSRSSAEQAAEEVIPAGAVTVTADSEDTSISSASAMESELSQVQTQTNSDAAVPTADSTIRAEGTSAPTATEAVVEASIVSPADATAEESTPTEAQINIPSTSEAIVTTNTLPSADAASEPTTTPTPVSAAGEEVISTLESVEAPTSVDSVAAPAAAEVEPALPSQSIPTLIRTPSPASSTDTATVSTTTDIATSSSPSPDVVSLPSESEQANDLAASTTSEQVASPSPSGTTTTSHSDAPASATTTERDSTASDAADAFLLQSPASSSVSLATTEDVEDVEIIQAHEVEDRKGSDSEWDEVDSD